MEASGEKASKLAGIVSSIQNQASRPDGASVSLYISVPSFFLSLLSEAYPKVNLLAQHLDDSPTGSTTGFQVPEVAKLSGAAGSILNHSEHRIPYNVIKHLLSRMRDLGMISIVCARTRSEVTRYSLLGPDFVAIEPPELIGSGKAVSKSRPELISGSKDSVQRANDRTGFKTRLLCGAGIVNMEDARAAIALGAEGILVASGVVKASNWRAVISSFVEGMKKGERYGSGYEERRLKVGAEGREGRTHNHHPVQRINNRRILNPV